MKMHSPALTTLLAAVSIVSSAATLPGSDHIAVALPAPELQSNNPADRFAAESRHINSDLDTGPLPNGQADTARMHPLRPAYLLPDGSLDSPAFEAAKNARRSVTPNQCAFKLRPDNAEIMSGSPLDDYYQWVLDGLCYYVITAHASRFTLLPDWGYTNWKVEPADSQLLTRPREMSLHLWKPNMTKYEDCIPGDGCHRKHWASDTSKTPAKSCELVVDDGDLVDQDMVNEASVELMQACWILLRTTVEGDEGPQALESINVMPIRDVDPTKVKSILSAVDKREVATDLPALEAGNSVASATAAHEIQLHDIDNSKTFAAKTLEPVTVTVTAPTNNQPNHPVSTRSPSLTTRTRTPSSSATTSPSTPNASSHPWYSDDPDSMGSPNYKSHYSNTFNTPGGEGDIRSQDEQDAVRAATWMWVALGVAMAVSVWVAVCCGCCTRRG